MIRITDRYLKLDTPATSMILDIGHSCPCLLYYGKRLADHSDYTYFYPSLEGKRQGSQSDYIKHPSIVSSTGDGNQKESFAEVVKEGIFTNRFVLEGVEAVESFSSPLPTARNKGETVRLQYRDTVSGVTLGQYFTAFTDSDVIAAHAEVINTTESEIRIRRLMSLQLDLVADRATVSSFDGHWCHERMRHDTLLTAGKYENSSVTGTSSGEHNPFVMAEINGGIYGFNLIWSGNHKSVLEVSPYGTVRVLTGMNDYALDYPLAPGERLVSPQAITVYAPCEAQMTGELHKFSLNHIINPYFAYRDRPVLINNWEGTGFNFTGEKIYQIAQKAAECGIEMLVLDDGWFGKRDDDRSGLGDWYDNTAKTGGLKELALRIKALGLKFGLWVEPEMISADSDLYRAHPEYAQEIPGVAPIERRYQLCLDLCRREVVDYLADRLITLFRELDVDYVKWDHNRSMSDVYSHSLENQGRYFYDYYKNQTELLRRITQACPHVLFESCASGGCRYDLGMQYFMPQNWGSDNTNAYDRLLIQEGTLTAYPQSSMGAHVAMPHSHPRISLESRFNVAAAGAFGYELDITRMSEEDIATVKTQVAYYKAHRSLLQFGNYYKLGDGMQHADIGGWMVVSDDKSQAIATVISKTEGGGYSRQFVRFKGLDGNALYRVTGRPQTNHRAELDFTAYGDALMQGQLDLNLLPRLETDSMEYSSRFASGMFYIKKI